MMLKNTSRRVPRAALGAAGVLAMVAMAGCSPSSAPAPDASGSETEIEAVELGLPDSEYSLERLIEEAKKEDPITVSDTTSKIVEQAEAFTQEYGVQATGVKIARNDQSVVVTREAQAGAVQTDVLFMADSASAVGSLLPQGFVTSWLPPDLADDIAPEFHDPLMIIEETAPFVYNTEVYGDTCPIDNIWALTDEEWAGKVAIPDPQIWDYLPYWWNQLSEHEDGAVADAYEAYFGEPLETHEESATAQWVKDLAQNGAQVMQGDPDVADAVGAPGQDDPFIGIMHTAKFRDNESKDYKLGLCSGLEPYMGVAYAKAGVIASGTKSPNAAKLFVHYMLTEEGIGVQTEDGKRSANQTVQIPADEPSGIDAHWDELYNFKIESLGSDLTAKQDWLDFWVASR